jgi:hypothetical protein
MKKYLPIALAYVAGVVLANKTRSLPLFNKLPSV